MNAINAITRTKTCRFFGRSARCRTVHRKAPISLISINVRGRLRSEQEFSNIVVKKRRERPDHTPVRRSEGRAGALVTTPLHTLIDTKNTATTGIFLSPGAKRDWRPPMRCTRSLHELSLSFPTGVGLGVRSGIQTVFVA